MIKKYATIPLSLIVLLAPAGLAFADQGGSVHADQSIKASVTDPIDAQLNMHQQSDAEVNDGNDGNIDNTNNGNVDIKEQDNSMTEPSHMNHHEATSTEREADSADHNSKGGNIKERSMFSAFFSWFMGLPATTTVGEVRSTLGASTTTGVASTSLQNSTQIGFFQSLMHFFRFGFSKD
jgi:hypothetical protein